MKWRVLALALCRCAYDREKMAHTCSEKLSSRNTKGSGHLLFSAALNPLMNKCFSCWESSVSSGTGMTSLSRAVGGLAVTQMNQCQALFFSLHSLHWVSMGWNHPQISCPSALTSKALPTGKPGSGVMPTKPYAEQTQPSGTVKTADRDGFFICLFLFFSFFCSLDLEEQILLLCQVYLNHFLAYYASLQWIDTVTREIVINRYL